MNALLILPIVWIVTAAGMRVCALSSLPADATRLERALIGCAVGLGMLAYGVLAVGLIGWLNRWAVAGVVVALALFGANQHAVLARGLTRALHNLRRPDPTEACAMCLGTGFLFIALVGCFTPPTLFIFPIGQTEWDSLAYHLADPKIYIRAHRILYIPWESHSNFAFTAEMWYAIGLLFNSVPLAKLFHLTCGIGACLGAYAIGLRHLGHRSGLAAALLLAGSAPILAEAGTSYVDLAATFYSTLTLLTLLNGAATRNWRWITPSSAILMGFTLSCKALALTSLAMFAAGILLWLLVRQKQPIGRALGGTAGWCALSLSVGAPWYVKSYIWTGDPVFPFGWALFRNSHWNTINAAQYSASNLSFGLGHKPIDLIFAPWNVTMYPLPGHLPATYAYLTVPTASVQPFNNFQSLLIAVPVIFVTSLITLPFLKATQAVRALSLYAAISFVLWFVSMQYVRYLLPLFPVLALLSAWSIVQLIKMRRFSGYALAALAALSLCFTLYCGLWLAKLEFPVATGNESQSAFLLRTDSGYGAMSWLNSSTPQGSTIAFYGEPLGYYCDRNYFWADSEHSTYVPYQSFHTAMDLQLWLNAHHVGYILVNTSRFGMTGKNGDYTDWVYQLTAGSGPPVYSDRHGIAIWKTSGNS